MIAVAKEEGSWINIYDETGRQTCTIPKRDGLQGYNSTTVSVKDGGWINIYDETGRQTGTVPA